jgi:hypothetical protein
MKSGSNQLAVFIGLLASFSHRLLESIQNRLRLVYETSVLPVIGQWSVSTN